MSVIASVLTRVCIRFTALIAGWSGAEGDLELKIRGGKLLSLQRLRVPGARRITEQSNEKRVRLSLENSPWGEALSVEERIKNDEKETREGERFRQCDTSKRWCEFKVRFWRLSTKYRDVRINDDCLKTTEDVWLGENEWFKILNWSKCVNILCKYVIYI